MLTETTTLEETDAETKGEEPDEKKKIENGDSMDDVDKMRMDRFIEEEPMSDVLSEEVEDFAGEDDDDQDQDDDVAEQKLIEKEARIASKLKAHQLEKELREAEAKGKKEKAKELKKMMIREKKKAKALGITHEEYLKRVKAKEEEGKKDKLENPEDLEEMEEVDLENYFDVKSDDEEDTEDDSVVTEESEDSNAYGETMMRDLLQ